MASESCASSKEISVPSPLTSSDFLNNTLNPAEKENYVGLDCEMVGLGSRGKMSALARCCLVDFDGNVIFDKFVRPNGFVTDFRTNYSGVRKGDLRKGQAIPLSEVL